MSLIAFTPPAYHPPETHDLMARFRALEHYILHQFAPYLFSYLPERVILDSLLFNQELLPTPDGVTTVFTAAVLNQKPPPRLVEARIRLATDGSPQALLQHNAAILEYTTAAVPSAGEWTVVTPPSTATTPQPLQQIIVGTAPLSTDYFRLAMMVLA